MSKISRLATVVDTDWMNLQKHYKNRVDLIPNYINILRIYTKNEQQSLEIVIKSKSNASRLLIYPENLNTSNFQEYNKIQAELTQALNQIKVIVIKYPTINKDINYRNIQALIFDSDSKIKQAKSKYDSSSKQYNELLLHPPYSWLNKLFYHYQLKPIY
jgi:LemA protein